MKCEQCNNKFCKTLDETTKKQLCNYSVIVTQKRKQVEPFHIYKDSIEIILEGFCIVQTYSADGKRLFNTIMVPGDIIGSYLNFDAFENSPIYDIVALTDVKKCIIPKKVYDKLFHNNVSFANAIAFNLTEMLVRLTRWTFLHSLTGSERITYVCNELKKLGLADLNNLTQEDIAFIAGVSRVTVIRAMKKILLAENKNENFFP